MDQPSSHHFSYDRSHPPLFFTTPNAEEKQIWIKSMKNTTKEFYSLIKNQTDITSQHVMSNGMTVGEFCMWFLTKNHKNRKYKKFN